ncbi:MAG: hypothetical protein KBS81_08815 [Spirochaetales bacterium]|nr:hypothetical protein [Candidatus Physcosoma equi]
MTSWHDFFIGLGVGAGVAALIWIIYMIRLHMAVKKGEFEVRKVKDMLASRMELESEGMSKMKKELEELKTLNENLRISLQTMSQKPGKKEIERLQVYQKAVDRLTINSPGFGPAWQAALKESEDEFAKTYTGVLPFVRRVIPGRTNAQLMDVQDANTEE